MDRDDSPEPLLNSLPLVNAVLCVECEIISDSSGEVCAACGSRSLLNLGRVLGGSITGERAALIQFDPEDLRNKFTVLLKHDTVCAMTNPVRKRRQMHLFGRRGS